jgi:hypothetical protein
MMSAKADSSGDHASAAAGLDGDLARVVAEGEPGHQLIAQCRRWLERRDSFTDSGSEHVQSADRDHTVSVGATGYFEDNGAGRLPLRHAFVIGDDFPGGRGFDLTRRMSV